MNSKIEKIEIGNFKVFGKQSLTLKSLTLLSGMNGSGKSSVLQALLLLMHQLCLQPHQRYKQGFLEGSKLPNFVWECIAEEDVFFKLLWTASALPLSDIRSGAEWHFHGQSSSSDEELLWSGMGDFYEGGTSSVYEAPPFSKVYYFQVGRADYGELVARLLNSHHRSSVPLRHYLQHPTSWSSNVVDQVERWMKEVTPGIDLELTNSPDLSLEYLQNWHGAAAAHVLPIITVLMVSQPGTLLLLENPEGFLHPRGQTKLGKLLAMAANAGFQIILETHSDHILSGVRLSVRGGKLDPDDVQFHHFYKNGGKPETNVVSPEIDSHGRISSWPDGFFDETDFNLEELLG